MASLFTLLTSACSSQPDNTTYAVSIKRVMPINTSLQNGRVVIENLTTIKSVFFIGDYCIGRLSPSVNYNTQQPIYGTEPYFIRKVNEKYGFLFRSADDRSAGERFNADIFMVSNGLQYEDCDFPGEQDSYRSGMAEDPLASSHIEKFSPRGKPGPDSEPDTLYYFFSKKMDGLKYTISKKLDSLTGMKLYKISSFYKEGYSEQKKIVVPDHEISLEFVPIDPALSDREKALLEHFKKMN